MRHVFHMFAVDSGAFCIGWLRPDGEYKVFISSQAYSVRNMSMFRLSDLSSTSSFNLSPHSGSVTRSWLWFFNGKLVKFLFAWLENSTCVLGHQIFFSIFIIHSDESLKKKRKFFFPTFHFCLNHDCSIFIQSVNHLIYIFWVPTMCSVLRKERGIK